MKYLLQLLITLLIFACTASPVVEQAFEVNYEGALKNIMHKGDLSAKASLADYENIPNLYALGAIEHLKGEIQIFDGQVYNRWYKGTVSYLIRLTTNKQLY